MKQTKKLSRSQREYLESIKKIDTQGLRLIEDNPVFIKLMKADGSFLIVDKKD